MKNFHQNLMICLALGLCGLCAYQWYVLSAQRGEIGALADTVSDRNGAIQSASNTLQTADHQIAQMDAELSGCKAALSTNTQLLATQGRELARLQFDQDALTNRVEEYKQAVAALESRLKDAYDGIRKQNETIRQITAQRDELVGKYNASVQDRNDIVSRYNDLAKQVEKSRAPPDSPPSPAVGGK